MSDIKKSKEAAYVVICEYKRQLKKQFLKAIKAIIYIKYIYFL